MKHFLRLGLLILALSGCNSGPPKSLGKLVVTNNSSGDVEVIDVMDIGETSLSGTISSGSKIEAFFATASAPTTCTIKWRTLNPKGSIKQSNVPLGHLAGTRLGGYELVLDGSLNWNAVAVPYPGAVPTPTP